MMQNLSDLYISASAAEQVFNMLMRKMRANYCDALLWCRGKKAEV